LHKTEDGIRVVPDHGDELMADVVLFATGNNLSFTCFIVFHIMSVLAVFMVEYHLNDS